MAVSRRVATNNSRGVLQYHPPLFFSKVRFEIAETNAISCLMALEYGKRIMSQFLRILLERIQIGMEKENCLDFFRRADETCFLPSLLNKLLALVKPLSITSPACAAALSGPIFAGASVNHRKNYLC